MKVHKVEQGTDEWHKLRLGKVTGSRLKDVLSKGRGSAPSKTRLNYMYQVVAERLTGQPQDTYSNEYMEWGQETEAQAKSHYEYMESVYTDKVGFVEMNEWIGASPDALIGDDGLLEIKCPKSVTQIQRAALGEFPSEYTAQVQGQIWVCEREWCDFVSFDPRIRGDASYFKIRVFRDDEFINDMAMKIDQFITETREMLDKLGTQGA